MGEGVRTRPPRRLDPQRQLIKAVGRKRRLPTISIPVLCSDGRKGIIIATRDNSGMSGGGQFTLNDGTTGDFMFGAAAGKL